MDPTPKNTRPKLRNIPLPHQVVKCFLCGKPLLELKGDDEAIATATSGIIILTCAAHVEGAHALLRDNIERLQEAFTKAKEQQQQQSKIE